MRQKAVGKPGFTIAIALAVAFCVISYFFWPYPRLAGRFGVCLPSPNEWTVNPQASWMINSILMIGCGIALAFLNRAYSFVKSTDYVLSSSFIVLATSNPWLTTYLNTSTILVTINLICLMIMFATYKKRNATQEVFSVATLLSLGSMIQYSFLAMIPAYIGVAAVMKCLKGKESVAFILGLAAPYWVGIGLGLVPIDSFRLPEFSNLFEEYTNKTDLFMEILNVGSIAVVSILLGLNNAVKLYAGNSQIRAMNNAVNIVAGMAMLAMMFDFRNLPAYMATLYLGAAVQLGNLMALFNIRKGWITMTVGAVLMTSFFIAMFLI